MGWTLKFKDKIQRFFEYDKKATKVDKNEAKILKLLKI